MIKYLGTKHNFSFFQFIFSLVDFFRTVNNWPKPVTLTTSGPNKENKKKKGLWNVPKNAIRFKRNTRSLPPYCCVFWPGGNEQSGCAIVNIFIKSMLSLIWLYASQRVYWMNWFLLSVVVVCCWSYIYIDRVRLNHQTLKCLWFF